MTDEDVEANPKNNNNNNLLSTQPPVRSTQKSKFTLTNVIPDDQIKDSDVVLSKDLHENKGTKKYHAIMELAPRALEKKFGVTKHKIVTPNGADASSGNQIKNLNIQNTIMDWLLHVQEGLIVANVWISWISCLSSTS